MPRKKKVTEKPMTLSLRAGKAGNDRQMIPADNVDAEGTAWATVGENIRKGKNGSGGSGGGGGDATLTKETIANFYNSLTGGDWRVADITIMLQTTSTDQPTVEYHDTDYSDQFGVTRSGMTCKSGVMGTPIYLGETDPHFGSNFSSNDPMFYTTMYGERGNWMAFYDKYSTGGWFSARVLLPFQYADPSVNSWNHNSEDDWDLKVQKWQKEDAEAVQKEIAESAKKDAVSEEHTEV